MKLCIFSDSHGREDLVRKLPLRAPADAYLFCGDGLEDTENFPGTIYRVAGNCDWGAAERSERLLELGGVRIFMTHGHHYRVKYDLYRLELAAREQGARVVCYGHTHVPDVQRPEGLLILNPGSLAAPGHRCILLDTDTLEPAFISIV